MRVLPPFSVLTCVLSKKIMASHSRVVRDSLQPYHNYQGLDLSRLYNSCDEQDLWDDVIKNQDNVLLDCVNGQGDVNDELSCLLTCEKWHKIKEFKAPTRKY